MKRWKYMLPLAATFLLMVLFETFKPQPLDWTPSLRKKDKIPYGTYALFTVLPGIFPGQKIVTAQRSIYETLKKEKVKSNFILMNEYFSPEEADLNALLAYTAKGNSIFLAAESFDSGLMDTLKIETDENYFYVLDHKDTNKIGTFKDSVFIHLTADKAKEKFYFPSNTVHGYFSNFDTLTAQVICTNEDTQATCIHIPFGKGELFLTTTPLIYGNYNLLRGNTSKLASATLSLLPNQKTWWDDYQLSSETKARTPLRFILQQQPLRWALFTGLAAVLLFMLFEAKRKQRVIPVHEKTVNYNLEFTQTLAQLYLYNKDHKGMAMKKIAFFLENIRSAYSIRTDILDENFVYFLSRKSGQEEDLVRRLITLIGTIKTQPQIRPETLLQLNTAIDEFKINQK